MISICGNLNKTIFFKLQASYRYNVDLHDERVAIPCNRSDLYFWDRFADISNLKFEYLSNGSIYVNGFAVVTKDFGTDIVGQVFYHTFK